MADDFDSFAEEAAELFGLNANEAADMLDSLEAEGFDPESDSLADWAVEASDIFEDVVDTDEISEDWWDYDLDPDFPEDEWMEADVEYEVAAQYEED